MGKWSVLGDMEEEIVLDIDYYSPFLYVVSVLSGVCLSVGWLVEGQGCAVRNEHPSQRRFYWCSNELDSYRQSLGLN